MTATTLKKRIQKAMDNVNDESVLEEIYSILEKAKKRRSPMKPMTLKELFARDAKSEKDIKAGRLIPVEEVRKRFATKK